MPVEHTMSQRAPESKGEIAAMTADVSDTPAASASDLEILMDITAHLEITRSDVFCVALISAMGIVVPPVTQPAALTRFEIAMILSLKGRLLVPGAAFLKALSAHTYAWAALMQQ